MKLDLSVLASVADPTKIETGAYLHLTSSGVPLYRDAQAATPTQRVRAKVRSVRSKTYQDYEQAAQRSAFGRTRKAKGEEVQQAVIREIVREQRKKMFATLLIGLENVSNDPKVSYVEVDEDDALALAEMPEYGWLVDQVIAFGQEDANFGADVGNADGDAPKAPPSISSNEETNS